jgi:copper oxidase (laccase) domain-containing protein
MECGIDEKSIEVAGICTYKNHAEFFSARRLGINSGRIFSGIMARQKNCHI